MICNHNNLCMINANSTKAISSSQIPFLTVPMRTSKDKDNNIWCCSGPFICAFKHWILPPSILYWDSHYYHHHADWKADTWRWEQYDPNWTTNIRKHWEWNSDLLALSLNHEALKQYQKGPLSYRGYLRVPNAFNCREQDWQLLRNQTALLIRHTNVHS